MTDFLQLTNKTILITGATVGIGLKTAIILSESGAKIVMLGRSAEKLEEAKSLLSGDGHHIFEIDLNNIQEIEGKIKDLAEQTGPIDGFVHCAGVRSRRPLNLLNPKSVQEVMNLNFGSFVEMVRCLTKKGRYNESLSIVGVSSIAAKTGGAGVTAYAASKAAMESAVRCLAVELAPKSIRLNTVEPAQINTPAFEELMKNNTEGSDKTLSRQYLGLGETEDVANAIAFLLSAKSRFITGSTIPVDGGYLSS